MIILGVIPARGGSKGIKNKNLLRLQNKSLIEIAIKSSKKSKLLDRIIFSSDSNKLIKEAKKNSIEVLFKRPKKYSTDKASSFSVLRHAVNYLEKKEKKKIDIVVLLQPTTPFRTAKHIDEVIRLLLKKKLDASMSIKKPDYPPHWMMKIKDNYLMNILKNGSSYFTRQSTPEVFQPSGMVYVLKRDLLFKIKTMLPNKKTGGVIVDQERGVNIDTLKDYYMAKILYKKFLNK